MIDDSDIVRLKEIFVTRERCGERADLIDRRLSNGDTKFALIEQQLSAFQIYPKRVMEGETRTIMEHVIRGGNCCMLPEFFLPLARQAGLVIGSEFCPMNHVLAYSSQLILSPAVQELMQLVIKAFSTF